jgi:polysaccharide export outer membrane protein
MIISHVKKLLPFCLIIFVFSACIDEKKIAYFQKTNEKSDTIDVAKAYIPKIQPGDILSIPVNSLSPEASSFFNPYTPSVSGDLSGGLSSSSSPSSSSSGSTTSPALSQSASPGYLVDPNGNIQMPLLGTLHLSGLTTVEAQDSLKKLLTKYLKEVTVTVRFLNFKISILGEVARPSVYVVPNERITLPEALSMAGDLTIYARRDNVQVIRDVNGKKEFGIINLNSREVFNSPYYYLHANDLIYVQPGKSKAEATDHSYILVPSLVSLISVLVLLFKK